MIRWMAAIAQGSARQKRRMAPNARKFAVIAAGRAMAAGILSARRLITRHGKPPGRPGRVADIVARCRLR